MRVFGILSAAVLAAHTAAAQVAVEDLQDRAVEWVQDYLRIDTINPPGNEIAGATFLARILEAEGIGDPPVWGGVGRG